MNARQKNPLDQLRASLGEISRGLADLRDALRSTNDPELNGYFGAVVETASAVVASQLSNTSDTIADDLANLYSLLARREIMRDDPELGEVRSLGEIRGARGNLLADISQALAAAKHVGLQPSDQHAIPVASSHLSRDGYERQLSALTQRLNEVASLMEEQLTAASAPTRGVTNLQVGLVNFYTDAMKIEIAFARFEAAIAQVLDLVALGRAVELIGRLTASFVATVKGAANAFSQGVHVAAEALLRPVKRVVSGTRAFVKALWLNRETILIAEVPRSGDRWNQINFDLNTYRNYFGVPAGAGKAVQFQHVRPDGSLGPKEHRVAVAVPSKNFRFEVGAAKGMPYPASGHPILVFNKLSDAEFRYMLLLPGSDEHGDLQAFLDTRYPSDKGKKRKVVSTRQLLRVWPGCPLVS